MRDWQNEDLSKIKDPYSYLALRVFSQAFRDVFCYFTGLGTQEEIKEGRYSLHWMEKMKGNFRIFAMASDMPLSEFHQLCLWKINKLKERAVKLKEKNKENNIC